MAEFTVAFNGVCSAGTHVSLTVTVGGRQHTVGITKQELLAGSDAGVPELILQRLKSFVLEEHAGNWATTIAALEAKTFKV